VFDAQQFQQSFGTYKCCRVSQNLKVFIHLYRAMKDMLERCQHIKRVVVEV